VLTSNRAPNEWPELFDNPLLANAALDRLAHRAIVVSITGRSYRLAQRPDGKAVALFEPSPPTATTPTHATKGERRTSDGPA
jgi:hypothetical protein